MLVRIFCHHVVKDDRKDNFDRFGRDRVSESNIDLNRDAGPFEPFWWRFWSGCVLRDRTRAIAKASKTRVREARRKGSPVGADEPGLV
jgi:hypothetical protein